MSETDKELADRLDAQDRLMARGYERKVCSHCAGLGMPRPGSEYPQDCSYCGGKGYVWQAPITK